jgi:molybdenum cofactor cytidylyltransferase
VRFGRVPLEEAQGAILAHSLKLPDQTLRKGLRLDAPALARLAQAGVQEITAAILEEGDVHEDEAAHRLAQAVAGAHLRVEAPFTGRANLFADKAGVLRLSASAVNRINAVDPAITLATLPPWSPVEVGRMVATVKIIPFAVTRESLERVLAVGAQQDGCLAIAPYRPMRVGLVATRLPALKESVLDKTRRALEDRLKIGGAVLGEERRVAHEEEAVRAAILDLAPRHDLLVLFGASAIVDEEDVLPAALRAAEGTVLRIGMPVDPGNLLLVGRLGGKPVLGAPGCARSPKENGFDWVLQRLLAGIEVTSEDIAAMGVGGLLMEIVTRPQPRRGPVTDAADAKADLPLAALILAAGRGTRMGGPNKLLASFQGKPLLRHVAEAALAGPVEEVAVVTGHERQAVEAALAGLPVRFVHNADFAQGMGTSLACGIAALSPGIAGAFVMLGDMPRISPQIMGQLAQAFDPRADRLIVVPEHGGTPGHPVLFHRRFFPALAQLSGDQGARRVLDANPDAVLRLPIGTDAVLADVDTPEALAALAEADC